MKSKPSTFMSVVSMSSLTSPAMVLPSILKFGFVQLQQLRQIDVEIGVLRSGDALAIGALRGTGIVQRALCCG